MKRTMVFLLLAALLAALWPAGAEQRLTKEGLIEALGVLNPEDTVSVDHYTCAREGDLLDLTIVFEDGVYSGGTDGYQQEWLVGTGIASEAEADLDGDGTDELLILYCGLEQPEDSSYAEMSWKAMIFEPVEGGYVQAAAFPLRILTNGTCERSVNLVAHDGRTGVAVVRYDEWDGGGCSVRAEVFDYDGEQAAVALLAVAGINAGSFAAIGPFSLEWREQLDSGDISYGKLKPDRANGLREGENYLGNDYIELYEKGEDGASHVVPEALEAFDAIAAVMKGYGVDAGYRIDAEEGTGYLSCSLEANVTGETLLWAKEYDGYTDASHIDVKLRTALDHGLEENR